MKNWLYAPIFCTANPVCAFGGKWLLCARPLNDTVSRITVINLNWPAQNILIQSKNTNNSKFFVMIKFTTGNGSG